MSSLFYVRPAGSINRSTITIVQANYFCQVLPGEDAGSKDRDVRALHRGNHPPDECLTAESSGRTKR
jgi:hypothetical protein